MQLTTSYQLVSSFNLTYGAMRTYAKYSSQSSTDNTTTYQIKQVYYCSVSGGYTGFDYAVGTLDGTQKVYNSYTRMYSGETTVQELTRVIEHNPDGSTPTKTIATSWTASFGGSGSTSVDVTFPNIARYPLLTYAPDFNDEGSPTISFTTVLGIPGATVRTILYDPVTGYGIPGIDWRSVNVASGSYTYNFTSAERNALRSWCNTSNTKQIGFHLLTEANGVQYWSTPIVKTLSIVNANPTFDVAYQDTKASTIAITQDNQQIIQNNSTLQVNITNAAALKQASLSTARVTINGVTTTKSISSATLNIDIGTLNLSDNTNATVSVIDSRGNTTTKTLALTILEWSLPTAIITLNRQQNYYTETDLTVDASYASLDSKNTLTIQYRKKKTTDPDTGWSNYTTIQNNTLETFSADNLYSWNIEVLLTDSIDHSTYNLTIGVGTPIFFIDREKHSLGLNCFPNGTGTLEIGGHTIFDLIYPVGSIYMSVNNTNPGTLFGGTWVAWGAGKVPVGVDTSQTEFNTVEKTGGSKYMQSHYHYSMQVDGNKIAWGGSGNELNMAGVSIPWTGNFNSGSKIITSNTGDGNSQNLQPYITVYMWKRTS